MAIVPCPQCAKPMEQDDGFCGSCGAITDPDLTIDDELAGPHSTAPDTAPASMSSMVGATGDHLAALHALDIEGEFDERTDVAPPPFVDPPPPGMVNEPAGDDFCAFLEEQTGAFGENGAGVFEEETGSHRADRQAMVQPQVVLRCKSGVEVSSLSPFEQHVLSFLDGRRPLARLRKKAGLSFSDLKVAIGMLADRGAIEVLGSFKPDLRNLLEDSDLDDTGTINLAKAAVPPPTPPQRFSPPAAASRSIAAPAPMPLPGQGSGGARPPSTAARVASASPAAAPQPVVLSQSAASSPRERANQLLERALEQMRAGKRPAAIALVQMAAELMPGDPKIEALRKTLLVRPGR